MPEERQKIILVDGHALAYQQFFALPVEKFTTSAGEPTNATYGFARTLLDILDENPDYLAVSFDQGMSGRDTVYEGYKSTREKMQGDMRIQMDRIRELVQAFNIPILELDDTEADDVIGTITRQAEAQGIDVYILTGDRDLLQLVTEQARVRLPARKQGQQGLQTYDADRVREEFGVTPEQIPDYKGLVGDTSDNIPGVKGIGDKTAAVLLQQYGTLKEVYNHIDEQKPGLKKNLEAGRESAFLSKMLATIKTDLPLTLDLKACVAHDYKREVVAELFRKLEFRRLIDRLPPPAGDPFTPPPPKLSDEDADLYDLYAPIDKTKKSAVPAAPVEVAPVVPANAASEVVKTIIVDTPEALAELVKALDAATAIAFDTETTSTEALFSETVGISLAVNETEGYYIPVGHIVPESRQLPIQTIVDAIKPAMTDPRKAKYGHNAAYDLIVMRRHGIDVSPITFDSMIAEGILNPESRNKGLKNLAWVRLNVEMTHIETLIGTGKKQITMDRVPIADVAPYAAADAVMTYRLVSVLRAELEKEGLWLLFKDMEMPLIPVLVSMHIAGARVDLPYLEVLGKELIARLDEIKQEIYTLVGQEFNIGSLKQLNEILFDKLKLPTQGLSRTIHGYSIDAEALESLVEHHPVVGKLLDWRALEKLRSTYVEALQKLADKDDRVHTTYHQIGAVTGRLSSETPNLQNIPIRTEEGRRVRRAFIARPGYKLLSVDYSQIELRILAHYSGDEFMTKAFESGRDIHAATAAAVFNIPYDEVKKEQRYMAKRVNFGLLYGMGAFRLSKEVGSSVKEATAFIETYFARLPKIREYLEGSKQLAAAQGYLETLFGRRRSFAVLKNASNDRVSSIARARAEREAINMPVQGTNADIIKKAMIELPERLQKAGLNAILILQVHDELVLEVPDAEVKTTAQLVQDVMSNTVKLNVPLGTEAKVGDNWADMTVIHSAIEDAPDAMEAAN
jgi:DNA polymerase-1